MTQFEEHMIDTGGGRRGRRRRSQLRGRTWECYVEFGAGRGDGSFGETTGRAPGACAEALRAIVRPEMGRFSMFIYGCILGNLFTMAIYPLHSESNSGGKFYQPKHVYVRYTS